MFYKDAHDFGFKDGKLVNNSLILIHHDIEPKLFDLMLNLRTFPGDLTVRLIVQLIFDEPNRLNRWQFHRYPCVPIVFGYE